MRPIQVFQARGAAGGGGDVLPAYDPAAIGSTTVLSNANRTLTKITNENWRVGRGTVAHSAGIHHVSFHIDDNDGVAGEGVMVGLQKAAGNLEFYLGSDANGYCYYSNATKLTSGSGSAYGATWTAGDVITVMYDAGNGEITFFKNGSSQGVAFTITPGTALFPAGSVYSAAYGSAVSFAANPVDPVGSTPW